MEPTPANRLGQRLTEIFSYTWGAIQGSTDDARCANWRTITSKSGKLYPVRPRVLWAMWQDPRQLVGVRFGRRTRYAMIDLDRSSPYIEQLPTIRAALETLGLCRIVIVRSSWSGGLHLYIPLPDLVGTFDLAVALKNALEACGIEIAPGRCEVFPNVKSHGRWWLGEFTEYNGHRLPLQPGSGSCLLNDALQPVGGDLERFFYAWDTAARCQDADDLQEALQLARENRKRHPRRRAAGPVEEWKLDLETEIADGWTAPGQTNHLLKSIACYGRVFEGLAGDELAAYTVAIATSRPGFAQFCNHAHEIELRSKVWARAAERYYWPLGTEPKREIKRYSVNDQRADEARERIRSALAELRFQTFKTIREQAREIARRAKCSLATLYKNRSLWCPDSSPVTALSEGLQGVLLGVESPPARTAETVVRSAVTHLAPHNEGCGTEIEPFKNLFPGGGERGARGEGRFSTDDRP